MKKIVHLIVSLLFIAAIMQNTSCTKRLKYDEFDPTKFLSLYELYEAETYYEIERAVKNSDSAYKLVLFDKKLTEVPV